MNAHRHLVVAIHGILTGQTDRSWPDDLMAFCDDRGIPSTKREYSAGPYPRLNWWKNSRQARGLANELLAYRGVLPLGDEPTQRTIVIVGHSNGTAIALETVKILAAKGVRVETLILVASVVDPDVERSGISRLLLQGSLRCAIAYASDCDLPLSIPNWLKWPWSDLGRRGFRYEGAPFELEGLLETRWFPGYGHGDYFSQQNRAATFEMIARDAGLPDAKET